MNKKKKITKITTLFTVIGIFIIFTGCNNKIELAKMKVRNITNNVCNCCSKIDSLESQEEKDIKLANCLFDISIETRNLLKDKETAKIDSLVVGEIYSELFKNCESFTKLIRKSTIWKKNPYESKIENTNDCNFYNNNNFLDLKSNGRRFIHNNGDYQIIEVPECGIKTKNKIERIDSCSFLLTYIESNDPVIRCFYKKGDITKVTIIEKKADTLIYEIENNGEYYLEKVLKIK